MIIDLSEIINYKKNSILIDEEVVFNNDELKRANIVKLEDACFKGSIKKNDYMVNLQGNLTGTMILKDDISLEEIAYPFDILIDEKVSEEEEEEDNLKIFENTIDILPILWQNIVLEVPSKVRKDNCEYHLKGDGWQLMSEDEYLNKES